MQIVTESGAVIGAANIVEESLSLQESICSETHLRFGTCEASVLKIRLIAQASALTKQRITPYLKRDGEWYCLGEYKVDSDKPTADRRYRDIIAYDAMYDIINAEVSDWYNGILPNADSTVTLKEFRDSFLAYFGIEQEEAELVNDSMTVSRTIEPSQLSGKTVITAICEINGCFGHIGRNGKFKYVFLQDTSLYPAETLYPADDLYPAGAEISASRYIRAEYEDYTTALINKLQIRQEEDDIGCVYGAGDNCYIIQDNFLMYGKSTEELNVIAANLYRIISTVTYQPIHVEAKGNPCLEVGDGIRLSTRNGTIMSYILQRTLKGIQALRDTYDAEGEQYQKEKVNSVHQDIIQLKGKANVLKRTIEETRLEIRDVENGLSSRITQNADSIQTEVARATDAESALSSRILQTAETISAEITRAVNAESSLSSQITQTAERITAEVTRATRAEEELSSRIVQTSDEIRLEITQRTSMYNEEVNTLQGGMDGSIDLGFFKYNQQEAYAEIATMSSKQCIYPLTNNGGAFLSQAVSLPSGTYLFSYEWLRSGGLASISGVYLYNLSEGFTEIYCNDSIGDAWPASGWHEERFQFTLEKTTRLQFLFSFSPPGNAPDRISDTYLTNIALYGTAQSVADAISDMKAELIMQEDKIAAKVSKNGVIAEINLSSEAATIKAHRIDLQGLVTATEFVSKYATIDTLNVITANLQSLISSKASIDELNAVKADIRYLAADKAYVGDVQALEARVNELYVTKLSAEDITADFLASKLGRVETINTNFLGTTRLVVNGYSCVPTYNSEIGKFILVCS